MRKRDKTIIAGAAAAFAVAGAGGAIAATDALSPEDRSQAVIDDAAKELGVEPSALSDALKHALENRIDEAVEAGRLTEEQGKELKKRIDSADVPLVFGGVGPGDRHGFGHGFGHFGFSPSAGSTPQPRTSASTRTSCATRSRTARALPRSRRTREVGRRARGRAGRGCGEANRCVPSTTAG